MIHIKYRELFDVEILHDFYLSGKSADFQLVPTSECAQLISRLGLRFLANKYGGKVFAKVNTVGASDIIATPLPDATKFSFKLKIVNNAFVNFSDVQLNKPSGSYYYFNNLVNNVSADGFPLLVSDPAIKQVSDNDMMSFESNTFSYVHSQAVAQRTGTIEMIDSGDKLVQTLDNNGNKFYFSYDLAKLPNGRAKFSVQSIEKERFYIIDASEQQALFALIDILYSDSLAAPYKFLQSNGAVTTAKYQVSFGSRKTKWRYIINKKYNGAISAVSIAKTTAPTIAFNLLAGTPPGQFIVTSNNLLPFKEENIPGIKLSDQSNSIIIPNLPNPSTALIKPEGADVFSDIIITI